MQAQLNRLTSAWFPGAGTEIANDINAADIQSRPAVHIWKANLDAYTYQAKNFYEYLTQDEQHRAQRYRFAVDRQRFIVARWILRSLLACYLDARRHEILFGYGSAGKPEVIKPAATQITFNLSHSGSAALYAVSWGREIGIDIEALRFDWAVDSMAGLVFSPCERVLLDTYPADQKVAAFLRGWTRKEAYIKAHGTGLSFPLQQIEVPFEATVNNCQINRADDPYAPDPFRLYSLDLFPGHVSALVVTGHPVAIVCNTWPAKTGAINIATRRSSERQHHGNAVSHMD